MEPIDHSLTKAIVQTVLVTAAASLFAKTFTTVVPSTRKFKIAEMAGSVIAGQLVGKFEGQVNGLVDKLFERRKARKLKLF